MMKLLYVSIFLILSYLIIKSDSTQTLTSSKDIILSASSRLPGSNLANGIHKLTRVNEDFWCPKEARNHVIADDNEWFQIEFSSIKLISFISAHMKFYSNNDNKFDKRNVFTYLKYQRAEKYEVGSQWYNYSSRSNGLNDLRLLNIRPFRELNPPIAAKRIRIFPYYQDDKRQGSHLSQPPNPLMCLQVSFNGIDFEDSLLEYRMPDGNMDGLRDFTDNIYDGKSVNNGHISYLTDGLGKLTDKKIFKGSSINEAIDSGMIVGWRATQPSQNNVTIIFKFDSSRNFKKIQIHSLANARNEAGLVGDHLEMVIIETSARGVIFNQHTRQVEYEVEQSQDDNLLIEITPGHEVLGNFLRLTLVSQSKWIFLSEISFVTDKVTPELSPERVEDIKDPSMNEQSQKLPLPGSYTENNVPHPDPRSIEDVEEETPYKRNLGYSDDSFMPRDNKASKNQKDPPLHPIKNGQPDYDEITRKVQIDKMNQTLVTIIISISVPILIVFLVIFLFMIFRWKFCGPRRDKKAHTSTLNHGCEVDPLKNNNDFYEVPINKYNYPTNNGSGCQQSVVATSSPQSLLPPHNQLMGYTNQFYNTNAISPGQNGFLPGSNNNTTSLLHNQNYLALNMLQTLQRNNTGTIHQNGFINPLNNFSTIQTNNSADSSGSGTVPTNQQKNTENLPKNTSLTTSAGSYSSSSGNSCNENYMNQRNGQKCQQQQQSQYTPHQFFNQRINMSLPPPPNQSPPPIPDSEPLPINNDVNSSEYASTSMLNMDMTQGNNNQMNWNYQQTLLNLHQVNPTAALLLAQQSQQNPLSFLQTLQHNQQMNTMFNGNVPDFLPPSTPPGCKGKSSRER